MNTNKLYTQWDATLSQKYVELNSQRFYVESSNEFQAAGGVCFYSSTESDNPDTFDLETSFLYSVVQGNPITNEFIKINEIYFPVNVESKLLPQHDVHELNGIHFASSADMTLWLPYIDMENPCSFE